MAVKIMRSLETDVVVVSTTALLSSLDAVLGDWVESLSGAFGTVSIGEVRVLW